MRILVTGSVGFIGYHLCTRLAADGHEVVGLDNFSDYYDVSLKEDRLANLLRLSNFRFYRADITDAHALEKVFVYGFDAVVHLAAQAGVRYSLENPSAYMQTNVVGFFNILECCRQYGVERLLFASSSSVYGNKDGCRSSKENGDTSSPLSPYAATKKMDEVLAYSYAQNYGLKTTGLRFFTVYGEMGRPDMACYKFAECLRQGRPVTLYNGGDMYRDFTYVGDAVECVVRILTLSSPQTVYNIGGGKPVYLLDFVDELRKQMEAAGLIPKDKYAYDLLPMQKGDVYKTFANTAALKRDIGYIPNTTLKSGLKAFVRWYKEKSLNR